jgi:hypothetical protein
MTDGVIRSSSARVPFPSLRMTAWMAALARYFAMYFARNSGGKRSIE